MLFCCDDVVECCSMTDVVECLYTLIFLSALVFTTIPYSVLYADLSKGPGYNYKLFPVTSSIIIIL